MQNSALWIESKIKPTGFEREILAWIVWPQWGRPQRPEPKIAWWKPGPGCFAFGNIENANHLVTHYMEIIEPNAPITHNQPQKSMNNPELTPASEPAPTLSR